MNTLEPEVRAALRRLVDERRREQLAAPTPLAPRRYTRCKTDAERRERRRQAYVRYDAKRGRRWAIRRLEAA